MHLAGLDSSVSRAGFLLTYAGDDYMQQCDSEGVVPHPPTDHRCEQKATAKVSELHGHQVHWEELAQEKKSKGWKKKELTVGACYIDWIWCAYLGT